MLSFNYYSIMATFGLIFNEYFLIAQILNLFSYYQSNFLILRLLFIGSSLFFVIFSLTAVPIIIDILIFNLTFFIINIWRSIPLFLNLVPPKMTIELEEIYSKCFSRFMRRKEFKDLFRIASRQIYRISCSIVKQGNGFSSLFFIPDIPENCSASINQYGGDYALNPYCWVGILEFLELISAQQKLTKTTIKHNNCFWRLRFKVNINNILIPAEGFNKLGKPETKKEDFKDYILKDIDESEKIVTNEEKNEINSIIDSLSKKQKKAKEVKTETRDLKKIKINQYQQEAKQISFNVLDAKVSGVEVDDAKDNADVEELNKILNINMISKQSFNKDCRFSIPKITPSPTPTEKLLKHYLFNDTPKQTEKSDAFIIYEFDLSKLVDIFNNHPNGSDIMKALYSMWLEHCSDIVKKKNEKSHTEVRNLKRTQTILYSKLSNPIV